MNVRQTGATTQSVTTSGNVGTGVTIINGTLIVAAGSNSFARSTMTALGNTVASTVTSGAVSFPNSATNQITNVAYSQQNPSEPLIDGTTASIYRVAALVEAGHSIQAIRRDYSMLTKKQIQDSAKYAALHPRPMDNFPKVILADALSNPSLDNIL